MSGLVGQGPLWLFLGGVITSLNPCMLAAVPLVAGYVGASGGGYLAQSLRFLFGFAGTLALLGLGAGALGGFPRSIQANWPYILALLYFVLGSYLLGIWRWLPNIFGIRIWGFYQFPRRMLMPVPGRRGSGVGALGLGSVMAFTPSPCITPVLVSVLAYVVPASGALKGALYLFAFGIGHGLPLLVAGSGAGTILTRLRSMAWARYINPALGLLLIVLGAYFFFAGLAGYPM